MADRLVILIPADSDDAESAYFRNFVFRVTSALKRDRLDVRVLVADAAVTAAQKETP